MEIIKGKTIWYDITNPAAADIAWLKREYGVHPIILDELSQPSARTHVESYDDYLYIVYQFPIYDPQEKVSQRGELDMIVTKHSVITIHYETLEPLEEFAQSLGSAHVRAEALKNSLQLTYGILGIFLDFNERQLRHIHMKVEDISLHLFKDREKELLKEISYVRRDLSEFRIIISPQEQLLHNLLEHGTALWGAGARLYLNNLMGEYQKIMNRLEDYRQAVTDFDATNNQLMNLKTTQVMKTFTALSFLTFPFVLLVAVLGLNTVDNPLIHHQYGFHIAFVVVCIGIIGLSAYFKNKKWL